jgi:hypothetical protein
MRGIVFFIGLMVVSLNSYCIYHYVQKEISVDRCDEIFSEDNLETGDIVLRRGKGVVSHWFASMSQKDPYFSHAGIVIKINEQVKVVSCRQDYSPSGLVEESLAEFLSLSVTEGYAIYRHPLSLQEKNGIDSLIQSDLNHIIPFDAAFELDLDSAYYCTEYIASRMNFVHSGLITESEGKGWKYIAPDDLYYNAAGRFICNKRILKL